MRLEEAQQTAVVANQTLLNMIRPTSGLARLNTSLQQRCAWLEARLATSRRLSADTRQQPHAAERDRPVTEHDRPAAEVETLRRRCADLQRQEETSAQEPARLRQRVRVAEANLEAARRNVHEAEALRLAAVRRAERYRRALLQHGADPADHLAHPADQPPEAAPEEYDTALEQSATVLEEADHTFDELRRRLGDDAPDPQPPGSDRPAIARGQLADDAAHESEDQTVTVLHAPAPRRPAAAADDKSGCLGWGFAGTVLSVIGVSIVVGLIDPLLNTDSVELSADEVVAGSLPSAKKVPSPSEPRSKLRALTYRLASGQSFSSTFALPRMQQRWFFNDSKTYRFNGSLDFVPDAPCPAQTRLVWRLDATDDSMLLTYFADFRDAEVNAPIILTAHLEAPAPCSGTVRLIEPVVYNEIPFRSERCAPRPSIAVMPKKSQTE